MKSWMDLCFNEFDPFFNEFVIQCPSDAHANPK